MAKILLHKDALYNNLTILSKKTESIDKLAPVLKDNAYGHGLEKMARLLKEFGIKKVVVRKESEAREVCELFEEVIVLGEVSSTPLPKCTYTINHIDDIKKCKKGMSIELKVDSGMHRNGIEPKYLKQAIELLKRAKIELKGVFTHNRGGDDLSSSFFWQRRGFEEIKTTVLGICKKLDIPEPRFHSLSSSGIFRTKKITDDLVRPGIALYGYLEWDDVFGDVGLKPVLELKARKTSTLMLKKGSKVGYSGVGVLKEDSKISSYDIGYGDGLFRASEHFCACIEDGREIIGRVSMDYFSLLGEDEEITVFRDAKRFAKQFKTISYDQLVKLSSSIPKEIV
ncbi:MAG: alanine racemase [Campylobacterales bacterium]